jgi:hypothetical protein
MESGNYEVMCDFCGTICLTSEYGQTIGKCMNCNKPLKDAEKVGDKGQHEVRQ